MAIAESRDTSVIESVERIRAADPDDMLSRIKDLPKQVRDAWAIASKATIAPAYSDVRNIVVAGMGGSAIGGDLAAALLADELKVPMSVHRDYGLPAYVGRDSLVIVSSYSGNTEETLSSFEEARKRGAKVLALTTGGKIAELARASNYPVVTFSYKAQPRAALGYSVSSRSLASCAISPTISRPRFPTSRSSRSASTKARERTTPRRWRSILRGGSRSPMARESWV